MSKVLFLSMPSHEHMSPTLGLASDLVSQGENVVFFTSEEFRKSVQDIGAEFVAYKEDMNILNQKKLQLTIFIDDVLSQIKNNKFDYIVYAEAYPFASTIARILDIPAVSSFAVFVPLKDMLNNEKQNEPKAKSGLSGITFAITDQLKKIREALIEKYNAVMTKDISRLLYSSDNLNAA